ncbi:MAG TPA: phosphoribosylformylglycinamidine cyclo-ligase [Nitrososphaerales archaeon]|nr:phosphoribosylformylglycinamidine cyclo-ligase [Nitrososphaerales archaeon]
MPIESYAKAGVNIEKVRRIHRTLAEQLGATFTFRKGRRGAPTRPIGLYGGVIDIGRGDSLTLHTDGVGTKVLVAQQMRKFDTVGIDCVAMTVNDLICLGSEPVALLDYIALQREDDALVEELLKGIVEGARIASVAVVGGETAIMRDVIKGVGGNGFDLASMGVGLVRSRDLIDGSEVAEGDVVLGVASSGLHSNGYTLARRVLRGRSLKERVDELGSTLGDALLEPTSIYVRPTMEAVRRLDVHGIAHITGGAFSKLTRLTPRENLMFDIALPRPTGIFRLLRDAGGIPEREMYRTFNMGIGLCLCLPEVESRRASRIFSSSGFKTHRIGSVGRGKGVKVNGLSVA